MSNPIDRYHVHKMEDFALYPSIITEKSEDGWERECEFSSDAEGKATFDFGHAEESYFFGKMEDDLMLVDDFEVGGEGSAHAWSNLLNFILPQTTGKLTVTVMFESGHTETAVFVDGKKMLFVGRLWSDWIEV